LVGGAGPKASNKTVVFTINRAKFDCGDIGARHAFGWGIFLDGKVDNLVYIILVKLVRAQSGICGFEVIWQAQYL